MKTCLKCDTILEIENFHKRSRAKDGLAIWCKNCVAEYDKNRRIKLADELKERRKIYYWTNRERLIEKNKKYHQTEAGKASKARDYQNHKENYRRLAKIWDRTEKGKMYSKNKAHAKRLIKTLTPKAEWPTSKQWKEIININNRKCYYCDVKLSFTDRYSPAYCTIDHIVPLIPKIVTIGLTNFHPEPGKHSADNIVCSCLKCNISKSNLDLEEWFKTNKEKQDIFKKNLNKRVI